MIEPLLPHRYKKCLKGLQMAAHSTAFSWTHLNMLASTTVTAVDVLPWDLQYSWPWLHSFRRPNGEISGNEGGHAIGPQLPVQLSGYVMFNHCQTSVPQELCHAGTATSASQLQTDLQKPQQNSSQKITISLSSQPLRWHSNVPNNSSPNAGTEAD